MRIGLANLLLLSFLLSAAPTRAQTDGPPPEYRSLIEQAVAESAEGRWIEARSLFRDAHRAYPNARTLRGIGMTSYELRDYTAAYRALAASLEETRRALDDEQRVQVEGLLHRVRDLIARYSVDQLGEGAIVSVDGVRRDPEIDGFLVLEAGRHDVIVRFIDAEEVRGNWVVRGGEEGPLPLQRPASAPAPAVAAAATVAVTPSPILEPTPPLNDEAGERRLLAGRICLGGGAAMVITGVALLAVGLNDVSSVEGASLGTEWSELSGAYDRSAAFTGAGIALLAAGGAAAIAGMVLVRRGPTEGAASVEARLLPTGASMEVIW